MAMTILWAILFCLILAVGWVMTLLAMPGNWLIVAAAAASMPGWCRSMAGSVWGGKPWRRWPFWPWSASWLELLAAARGVRQAGGSRWSAVLALLGSIAGATVGIFVGVPIPVVGSLVAAIVFAGVGAALGAMAGESMLGRAWTESREVGWAAFRGRLLGTLAKMIVGSVMVAVALCALVFA